MAIQLNFQRKAGSESGGGFAEYVQRAEIIDFCKKQFPGSPIEQYYIIPEVELVIDEDDPLGFFLCNKKKETERIPELKIDEQNNQPYLYSQDLPTGEGIHISHIGCLVRPPSNQLLPDDQWGLRQSLLHLDDETRQTFNDCIYNSLRIAHSNERFKNDIKYEKQILKIYQFFVERLVHEEPYMKDGQLKKRRSEVHRSTGESSTQAEHILLVESNANCNFYQYQQNGENETTKDRLKKAENELGAKKTSYILHLGGLFHDAKEDFLGDPQEREAKIINMLAEYKFDYLEKYLVPLIRMVTHDKKNPTSVYLKQMESPQAEIFEGYKLSREEQQAIQILAIHIKCMGDLAHNWDSPQSQKAMENKFAYYAEFIQKYYPDFDQFLHVHPSIKVNLEKFKSDQVPPKNFKPDPQKYTESPLYLEKYRHSTHTIKEITFEE